MSNDSNAFVPALSSTPVVTRLARILECVGAEATALQSTDESLSYGQLLERVQRLSSWLAGRSEHVIALWGDNSIAWVVVDLACQQAGKVCLPLPPFFSRQQLIHALEAADLLFCEPSFPHSCVVGAARTEAQEGYDVWTLPSHPCDVARLPEGTAKITFTSGSTGHPKGVCLSAAHQWQVAESLAQTIAIERPRHLCLLPLATLLENLAGVYVPLLSGGCVLLPGAQERGLAGSSGLDMSRLLMAFASWLPTTTILLPQLLAAMVAAVESGWTPPSSLRFMAVGGGKVDPLLLSRARELQMPVYEGYGLSECASVVALNCPGRDRPGSVGQVLPHCQVSMVDGEVRIVGSCFLGYWGESESWYPVEVASGDLGELKDGYLTLFGRRKNLIISSFGRNISPEWVESAVLADPRVSHCVVSGEGRPFLVALLGAPDSVSDEALDKIVAIANQRLPDYAQVRSWMRLPVSEWRVYMTANGRPQRIPLLANCAERLNRFYDEPARQ